MYSKISVRASLSVLRQMTERLNLPTIFCFDLLNANSSSPSSTAPKPPLQRRKDELAQQIVQRKPRIGLVRVETIAPLAFLGVLPDMYGARRCRIGRNEAVLPRL